MIILYNIFLIINSTESIPVETNKLDRFSLPDHKGKFGPYGGSFVPETLSHPLRELNDSYVSAKNDPLFQMNWQVFLKLLQADQQNFILPNN